MPKNKSKKGSKSRKNPKVSGAKKSTSVHEGFQLSENNNYGFSANNRGSKKSSSVYEGFPRSSSNNLYGFTPKRKSTKAKSSSNNEYGWNPNVSIYNTPEGHSVAGKNKKKKSKARRSVRKK